MGHSFGAVEETALFPWMTLLDNVAYGPLESGRPRGEAEQDAVELLRDVGLHGFQDRYPSQISGGMQRRAEVARALIARPKLMLMDEPFRGLDHMSRGLMQEYYLKLFDEHRRTTLFVTSEIDEAIFLADRLVILSYIPTVVQTVIEVPLPRPREFQILTSATYGEIKEHAPLRRGVEGVRSGQCSGIERPRSCREQSRAGRRKYRGGRHVSGSAVRCAPC